MAIFTINNFTRYNTDDLLALLEHVEKKVMAHAQCVLPVNVVPWQPNSARIPRTIILKTYNPASVYETFTDSINGKKKTRKVRLYVKDIGNHATNEVRLLEPQKMWDTPTEALAAAATGTLPVEAVQALAARFHKLYHGAPGLQKNEKLPSIRIEAKLQKSIDSAEKARSAHSRAYNAWSDTVYPLGKITSVFGNVKKTVDRGLKVLSRSKVPTTPEQDRFVESIRILSVALQQTDACLKDIEVQLRESQETTQEPEEG